MFLVLSLEYPSPHPPIVDHAHAAATELLQDAVMGNGVIQQLKSLAFVGQGKLIIALVDGNP
jgi:hypothetical protein